VSRLLIPGILSQRRGLTVAQAIAMLFPVGATGGFYIVRPGNVWQDEAGTTPAVNDGDPVARLDDLSGNGNHLTVETTSRRPAFKISGGKYWLEFDGTDDELNTGYSPRNEGSIGVSAFFTTTEAMYCFGARYLAGGDPGLGYRSTSGGNSGLQVRTNTGVFALLQETRKAAHGANLTGTTLYQSLSGTSSVSLSQSYTPGVVASTHVLNIGHAGAGSLGSGISRFLGRWYGGYYSTHAASNAQSDQLAALMDSLQ
jgi:hypothetical protein